MDNGLCLLVHIASNGSIQKLVSTSEVLDDDYNSHCYCNNVKCLIMRFHNQLCLLMTCCLCHGLVTILSSISI